MWEPWPLIEGKVFLLQSLWFLGFSPKGNEVPRGANKKRSMQVFRTGCVVVAEIKWIELPRKWCTLQIGKQANVKVSQQLVKKNPKLDLVIRQRVSHDVHQMQTMTSSTPSFCCDIHEISMFQVWEWQHSHRDHLTPGASKSVTLFELYGPWGWAPHWITSSTQSQTLNPYSLSPRWRTKSHRC